MNFKIGFSAKKESEETKDNTEIKEQAQSRAVKSVVRIYFKHRNLTCSYYNDKFDLHCGDLVYVDGKLEGYIGRVTEVAYNFKIKLSDYKRVVALVDKSVKGTFYNAGSHFVTDNRNTLPFEKVLTWFCAPEKEGEEYSAGYDDASFNLNDMSELKIDSLIADRGFDYYKNNNVAYFEISSGHGRAIVEGSKNYTVEFKYSKKGDIKNATCSCYCSGFCKHIFAAVLQLKETLEIIEKDYPSIIENGDYFVAVRKTLIFSLTADSNEKGSVTFG